MQRTMNALHESEPTMSSSMKKSAKDEVRIGEYAAKQPISGVTTVHTGNVKGFGGMSFVRVEETKRASA